MSPGAGLLLLAVLALIAAATRSRHGRKSRGGQVSGLELLRALPREDGR